MKKATNAVTDFFSEMGRKGGPAAAKVRWKGVSKKKRSAAMKALVTLRWEKAKQKQQDAASPINTA